MMLTCSDLKHWFQPVGFAGYRFWRRRGSASTQQCTSRTSRRRVTRAAARRSCPGSWSPWSALLRAPGWTSVSTSLASFIPCWWMLSSFWVSWVVSCEYLYLCFFSSSSSSLVVEHCQTDGWVLCGNTFTVVFLPPPPPPWRWGEREILYLSLHCHHQNDSCFMMGSDESHFNVS